MTDTIEHKCPNCGATIEFDADSQKVRCEYCGGEYDPGEFLSADEDIRIDADSIDIASNGGEQWSDDDDISEYCCSSCGGMIYTESTTSATICPFCNSAVILKGRLKGSLMPDKVLPFKISKEQALIKLNSFCRKKMFVNKAFAESSVIKESKGLYVPYWVYDVDLDVDLEYKAMKENVLIPGKNSDVVEQKYFKVTRKGTISFDRVPADGSSKMPDELMESIEPFDYGEAVDFQTAYLSGYVADKYDMAQEDVSPRVRERICEETDDRFRATIKGYDEIYMQESSIEASRSDVDYVLYPVWMFNMKWNESSYTFAINGQTGKVAGDLPPNKSRLALTSLAVFLGLMVVAYFLFCPGAPMEEIVDSMIFSAIVSAFIASSVYYTCSTSLKTVERKHGSEDYYREGSMTVEVEEEEFLYRKVTTR